MCLLSIDAFAQERQSWRARTETTWPAKPKIFTTWLIPGKVCWPLLYGMVAEPIMGLGKCNFGDQSWSTIRHTLVSEQPRTSLKSVQSHIVGEWHSWGSYSWPCDSKSVNQMDINYLSLEKNWVRMTATNPALGPKSSIWKIRKGSHPLKGCALWNPLYNFPASQPIKPPWGWLCKSNIFNDFTRLNQDNGPVIDLLPISSKVILQYLLCDKGLNSWCFSPLQRAQY